MPQMIQLETLHAAAGKAKGGFLSQVWKWWNPDCRGRLSWNAWERTHCPDTLSEPSTAADTEVKQINPFVKEQSDINNVLSVCTASSMLFVGRSVHNCHVQNQSPLSIPVCWQQLLSHQTQNNELHNVFFKGKPALLRVNSREEESDVSMEANIKTPAGGALKITRALGWEEFSSHIPFPITILFPNSPCFSSCHSCFLSLLLSSSTTRLEESLPITS